MLGASPLTRSRAKSISAHTTPATKNKIPSTVEFVAAASHSFTSAEPQTRSQLDLTIKTIPSDAKCANPEAAAILNGYSIRHSDRECASLRAIVSRPLDSTRFRWRADH